MTCRSTCLMISFLFSGILGLPSCASNPAMQSSIVNQPYHQARQTILENGWYPVQAESSGTGKGYCDFKFQNDKGEYLRVTTQGGDYNPEDAPSAIVVYAGLSDNFD